MGELSRRTGLAVRTIRFYSDSGVVAPTTRSPAGYRLYDFDALLRLELLRALRELGVDLPTVRRVLDRELSVAEVAAAHADALDVEIRVLQLRRSVLRAVARGGSGPTAGIHAAGRPLGIEDEVGAELMDLTRQKVARAMEAGIDPLGDSGARVVDDLVHRFAGVLARTPDPEFRNWLARRFEEAHDPRDA
ncbi:MerR family transcriptional regulator [Streptomyces vinaceus]|uniref:MerR family transcriptional regulator n=1 Tax=Streptomyces vinaceus TaxID=1960 RepID=UPI003810C495